ncbi:type VII secretion integral membrane protein EccD [Mycobacterium paraterrae]|uniref:Type VII secretion integral membrane protein EccD n=1 Tax=Mycobacterium paraterrae TaxID=577492 RepID=A0ABY3VGQ2_9MYCO|nr:type VII secretion integral membrane protein EccD [Mycobacterium paraterrae]UMB68590.1 type VII secretion integral membrane protein EccD [Mycobacterium paraterrae]
MYQGSGAITQRRLTVRANATSVDLVLPDAMPVGSLLPPILDALNDAGGVDPALTAVSYRLSLPDGSLLDGSKTLTELEIRDGCTLLLIGSTMEFAPPPCDDMAEAVSVTVAGAARPWTRRLARAVSSLSAGCLAGVAATVLIRTAFGEDTHRMGCTGVAVSAGLLALLASLSAFRVFDEPDAGLPLGLAAIVFVALAGLFVVPGGPGAPNALVGFAAAATTAAALRVFTGRPETFTALACVATTGAAAAAVGVLIGAPLPAVGAGMAAASLAVIEAAAPLSMLLARLSPVNDDGPDGLHARTLHAHTWLTSVIAAFSASAAIGAVSATRKPDAPTIVFAVVVGLTLVLRARRHHDVNRSLPAIVCGGVTLCAAIVAAAVAYPRYTFEIAAAAMALSTFALYLGFVADPTTGVPTGRRGVERVQYFTLATVAPLAFWVCGLYGAARSLTVP